MRKIWPMGCKKTPDADKVEKLLADPNYVAQPKIDGVRCVLHFDNEGVAHYTTRGASLNDPETPLDITHRLSHMAVKVPKLAGFEFDGEIWAPGYTSAEISGQVSYKSTVPVDSRLQLHVFDILSISGKPVEHASLSARMGLLSRVDPIFEAMTFLARVPTARTEHEKRQLLAQELEAGREGIVLKNLQSDYIFGTPKRDAKPANHWYKVKKKDTIDVKIIGSIPPEQFYRDPMTGVYDLSRPTKPWSNGWFGSLTFEFEEDGKVYTGSTSGMTDDMKARMSDGYHRVHPTYHGRIMEVEYMEKTADGNLRHPRFVRLREEIEK